jgi:hypothetical protein
MSTKVYDASLRARRRSVAAFSPSTPPPRQLFSQFLNHRLVQAAFGFYISMILL